MLPWALANRHGFQRASADQTPGALIWRYEIVATVRKDEGLQYRFGWLAEHSSAVGDCPLRIRMAMGLGPGDGAEAGTKGDGDAGDG